MASINSGALQQCTVCYDELSQDLTAAPCGHVFHSICIDQWHRVNAVCPVCKTKLPKKLLRLFFEPQNLVVGDASTSSVQVAEEGEREGGEGQENVQTVSAEVTRLRREVASSNKAIEACKEICSRHKDQLRECKQKLRDDTVQALFVRTELGELLQATKDKLQTARIDVCKKHKELNRLKREMEGTNEKLRKVQGDKVAHQYLAQFASQGTGLGGLGQVDVEVVLRQVTRGNAQAETIIRGQHEQLSRTMEREQRTKRELLKVRREGEAVSSELEELRTKVFKSRKEVRQLEKALSQTRVEPRDRESARSPSVGSFLDSAKEMPSPQEEGKGGWVLSRKRGGGNLCASKGEGVKRAAPTGRTSGVGTDRKKLSGKRRAVTLERQDDLVSLGSDDDSSSGDADENEGEGAAAREESKWKPDAASCRQLEKETRFSATLSSHSFLKKATPGGSERQEPGKYIVTGFDAMGGRHSVRASSSKAFGLNSRRDAPRSSR